jgi:2-isopropylmalate synthase
VKIEGHVIDGSDGTGAKVRVQIESRNARDLWTTMGVSENIIEASYQALADSIQYRLSEGRPRPCRDEAVANGV